MKYENIGVWTEDYKLKVTMCVYSLRLFVHDNQILTLAVHIYIFICSYISCASKILTWYFTFTFNQIRQIRIFFFLKKNGNIVISNG